MCYVCLPWSSKNFSRSLGSVSALLVLDICSYCEKAIVGISKPILNRVLQGAVPFRSSLHPKTEKSYGKQK